MLLIFLYDISQNISQISYNRCSTEYKVSNVIFLLLQVSSPTLIVERAGSYAWAHKSWRVREEFARTVTSAIGLFASTELPLQRAILPPVGFLTSMNITNIFLSTQFKFSWETN